MNKLMILTVAAGICASSSFAYARGAESYLHAGRGSAHAATRVVYRDRVIIERPVLVGPSCMQWDDTLDQWENICD